MHPGCLSLLARYVVDVASRGSQFFISTRSLDLVQSLLRKRGSGWPREQFLIVHLQRVDEELVADLKNHAKAKEELRIDLKGM